MMRNPASVRASASPRHLAALLLKHRVSGLPVVNSDGRVVGDVSLVDLLKWCLKSGVGFGEADVLEALAHGGARPEAVDFATVADFMTHEPAVADVDEWLGEAAHRMAESDADRLVVLDRHGKLGGVLTRTDVLRALSEVRFLHA